MLIEKTVQIAIEKGIIKSKSIIIDSTHTKSRYNSHPIREVLQEQSKKLRRAVYETDEKTKDMMPAKNTEDCVEKEVEYCETLIKTMAVISAIFSGFVYKITLISGVFVISVFESTALEANIVNPFRNQPPRRFSGEPARGSNFYR